ncbi:MAG: hypothetical protein Q9188_002007 [Gyalolechia gomerana]
MVSLRTIISRAFDLKAIQFNKHQQRRVRNVNTVTKERPSMASSTQRKRCRRSSSGTSVEQGKGTKRSVTSRKVSHVTEGAHASDASEESTRVKLAAKEPALTMAGVTVPSEKPGEAGSTAGVQSTIEQADEPLITEDKKCAKK